MAEASRLSTAARALRVSLEALADALAQARPEATAHSETDIEVRVRDFRDAAALAATTGEVLPEVEATRVRDALQRCRRLGLSVTMLAGAWHPAPSVAHGYSPVGHPLNAAPEAAFVTARG
ncbi:MAG TPA: hypothetical protein VMF13_14035 [Luteitalea sp.]|nr:hypothetical protein [Luteitalea sp.]